MEIRVETIQGEERDGYYVPPLLKRVWAVHMDILKVIDTICKRHGIKYYGWYGTLLGAVRHRGHIPWDDDMDLAMLREDYERFRYYAKTELPTGWLLKEKYPTWISVQNTDKIRVDQEFLNEFHGCPFATGVDIFCFDGIPKNKADEELQLNLFRIAYNLCLNWDQLEGVDDKNRWLYLKELEQVTGYHFDQWIPIREQLYFLADRLAAMYWEEEFDELSCIHQLRYDPKYRIPKSCFDEVIELPFENITLPVLKDYDLICKLDYGDDYMTPIKRNIHDSLPKQIDLLKKWFKQVGKPFPACFDMTFE